MSSKVVIYQKTLDQITAAERKRLNYLTLKGGSMMREEVLQRKYRLKAIQLFIAVVDETIVGWSAVVKEKVYTYVMKAFRRQGIGSELLTRASNWMVNNKKKKAVVLAWDDNSTEFFSICENRNIPVDVVLW